MNNMLHLHLLLIACQRVTLSLPCLRTYRRLSEK
jgi:hypothetical protein